jgi:hypothetical protein
VGLCASCWSSSSFSTFSASSADGSSNSTCKHGTQLLSVSGQDILYRILPSGKWPREVAQRYPLPHSRSQLSLRWDPRIYKQFSADVGPHPNTPWCNSHLHNPVQVVLQ